MKTFKVPLALALLTLSACANPYHANFNATLERMPAWMGARLAPAPAKPTVMTSQDIRTDNWKLFERGYVMVGFAKFDGPATDIGLAVSQAKTAGAEIVVVEEKYTKTLTETVAVTQWPADETTDVRQETTTNGPRGARTETQSTEVRTSHDPETIYVPQDVEYFEHSATFWRKVESPLFGALVQDLSDPLKQSLQSNHGLVVRAVMIDSPAFTADLLKGDIILTVNGQPAPSAKRFYDSLSALAGKELTMTVRRGSGTLDRKATLNR